MNNEQVAELVVGVVDPELVIEPVVGVVDPEPDPEPVVGVVDSESDPEPIVAITELCIAGGGQRGISYIGVLKRYEEEGLLKRHLLKKVIGTSIGAFIIGLYILGYDVHDLYKLLMETDVTSFNDISLKTSILKGDSLRNWVFNSYNTIIDANTFTFLDFYKKTNIHFIVCTTCLDEGAVYMDHINTPDVLVYSAIIASCNLPFIFDPYVITDKKYIDGGVLENFPMYLLSNKAYGIRTRNHRTNDITTLSNYLLKLSDICYQHLSKFKNYDPENVIEIDTSDQPLINFNINIDEKITLYMRGYITADHFLKRSKIS